MELYRGRLIAYSLGNFSSWEVFGLGYPNNITAVLNVTLAPNGVATAVRVTPVVMEKPGRPQPDPERRAVEILRTLSQEDFGHPLLDTDGRWARPAPAAAGGPQER